MPQGSQVLLIVALCEILNWERDPLPKVNCPLSSADIERLCELLNTLTHELPVEMAERALGITLDKMEGISSISIHDRAFCVYNSVMVQRSSSGRKRKWGGPRMIYREPDHRCSFATWR
ncbi:hypothetical protein H0H87_009999, partial [Tephrocybe sp. NHM501043]